MRPLVRTIAAVLCLIAVAAGCDRERMSVATAQVLAQPGAVTTVERRLRELRRNDLAAYARHSVPPALYASLEAAWSVGDSRWPLTELPLDERIPGLLATLGQPGAQRSLEASHRREFAGAHAELRSAATMLGVLGTRYLQSERSYSENERAHYLQLAEALKHWAGAAPLGDHARAKAAIGRLTAAARRTGLVDQQKLAQAGMRESLRRLGPFFGETKQVLADYGLDIDGALANARVEPITEQGDRASVRLHYTLAGRPVQADLELDRIDGRWYLHDALAHARAQLPADTARGLAARGE